MGIDTFHISIPESELVDLKYRLENARLTKNSNDAEWKRGINEGYMNGVLNYWKNEYN